MTKRDRDAECTKVVLVRGEQLRKYEVLLGREFIEDGRVWQTSMSLPVKFDLVEVDDRLKFGDDWCVKTGQNSAHALSPNNPFGQVTSKQRIIQREQTVRLLNIDDRGAAQ